MVLVRGRARPLLSTAVTWTDPHLLTAVSCLFSGFLLGRTCPHSRPASCHCGRRAGHTSQSPASPQRVSCPGFVGSHTPMSLFHPMWYLLCFLIVLVIYIERGGREPKVQEIVVLILEAHWVFVFTLRMPAVARAESRCPTWVMRIPLCVRSTITACQGWH